VGALDSVVTVLFFSFSVPPTSCMTTRPRDPADPVVFSDDPIFQSSGRILVFHMKISPAFGGSLGLRPLRR